MSDEIFDPELHSADKNGNPTLNRDGSFRKKRKPAGGGRAPKLATARGTTGKAPANDRDRYAKGVRDALAIPILFASMADPVDGYTAAEMSPIFAEAVGDLAVENPQVAAICERLATGGAMGNLVAVTLMIGAQFASNHGMVPEHIGRMVGLKPRSEIEKVLQQRGEQLAREHQAEQQFAAEQAAQAPAEAVEHDFAA